MIWTSLNTDAGLQVLRTVNRRDIVPKVPGLSKDEVEGRYVTNNDGEDGGSFKMLNGFDVKDPMKGLKDAREQAMQAGKEEDVFGRLLADGLDWER